MFSPAGLGQTIAVVDQSGKVVSTSKHLLNVFREAKFAYLERKAEIAAVKQNKGDKAQVRRTLRAYTIDDSRSATSHRSHRPHRSHRGHRDHERRSPTIDRRHSGGPRTSPRSPAYFEYGPDYPAVQISPSSPHSPRPGPDPQQGLIRRHTTRDGEPDYPPVPYSPARSISTGAVDMDLAYGDMPLDYMTATRDADVELKGLVGRVSGVLEGADCLKHSVTHTIKVLQKNPDAMAAVALTLAEISNLLKKMAPGALTSVRSASPAVFALLSSPQFLIAAGVGVGVTVIAFGGYKIIKKIQTNKDEEEKELMDPMIAIPQEVSRIETWRRGIAEAEAESVGTSVEGEFITPAAASLSRANLREETLQRSRTEPPRSVAGTETTARSRKTEERRERRGKVEDGGKERQYKKGAKKEVKKEKKVSPLRAMFKP